MVRRGLACLIVDGPGNGESIRFRGLKLRHDMEVPAGAAVDYLESRRMSIRGGSGLWPSASAVITHPGCGV